MKKILLLLAVAFCSLSINAEKKELINSKCYRGSAELGYSIGAIHHPQINRFEINTSHGYQFNPYLYVGGGLGMHIYSEFQGILDYREKQVDIPIFAHLKANFIKKRVTPFVDGRLGYHLTKGSGLYAFIGLGCRCATIKKQGINLTIGYSASSLTYRDFGGFLNTYSLDYYTYPDKATCEAISIKLSYDF